MERTKVLVVDDSALMRRRITAALEADPAIEVVGQAADPYEARDRIAELRPDLLTLDVEMPRMDGITFLRKLMRYQPMPVVVVSAYTEEGTVRALEALDAGALEVVPKPSDGAGFGVLGEELRRIVRHLDPRTGHVARAAPAPVTEEASPGPGSPAAPADRGVRVAEPPPQVELGAAPREGKLVAIGASTGGTVAIEKVLTRLPRRSPPIVIAQHMPPLFTRSYAERLNRLSEVEVREAAEGDLLHEGLALVAPGGKHLIVRGAAGRYRVNVKDGPHVSGHRPSVDVLFRSVAIAAGDQALGILLTGMGSDGARGLRELHDAGARTIAQDEASCVVFGMPKVAIELGAVDEVMPLEPMPQAMLRWAARAR